MRESDHLIHKLTSGLLSPCARFLNPERKTAVTSIDNGLRIDRIGADYGLEMEVGRRSVRLQTDM